MEPQNQSYYLIGISSSCQQQQRASKQACLPRAVTAAAYAECMRLAAKRRLQQPAAVVERPSKLARSFGSVASEYGGAACAAPFAEKAAAAAAKAYAMAAAEAEENRAAATQRFQTWVECIRQRSAAATLKRVLFRRPETKVALALHRIRRRSAAATLKRACRRLVAHDAVVLRNLQEQQADPSSATREEWSKRSHLPHVKQALDAMLQMLSRVCCRRIAAAGPRRPWRHDNNNDEDNSHDKTAVAVIDPLRLLRAYQQEGRRVDFAEAFFLAKFTAPAAAGAAASNLKPTAAHDAAHDAARLELNNAMAGLGELPHRFSMLTAAQRTQLKAAAGRLVTAYTNIIGELKTKTDGGGEVSLANALAYEIAMAAFSDMCRQHTHRVVNTKEREDGLLQALLLHTNQGSKASAMQAIINLLLLELVQSLDRMLKRSRVVEAVKLAVPVYHTRLKERMVDMLVAQETQIGKIAAHLVQKLGELLRILGGEPIPSALLERMRIVFVESLSSTSDREMRLAAFASAGTLMLYRQIIMMAAQQHASEHDEVHKDAALHIYAAVVRSDAAALNAPVLERAAIDSALKIIAANRVSLHVPLLRPLCLPILTQVDVGIDAWQVVRVGLCNGHTGVAAHLLYEAMASMKLAGKFSESRHSPILAIGKVDALIESPMRALEVSQS